MEFAWLCEHCNAAGREAIATVGAVRACHHDSPARQEIRRRSGSGTVLAACDYLATSRPTAVNLVLGARSHAHGVAEQHRDVDRRQRAGRARCSTEASAIHAEDEQMCAAIGRHGADLLADFPVGAGILTHCNAGALATAGDGTALAVIFELARRGKRPHVWVDETRPLLQGARLTAWELTQRGIDCTLICDSMAAQVMREGRVQAVIIGADRDRRQRRRGQQDRHLRRRRAGGGPRHSVLRRGADEHVRSVDCQPATRSRSSSAPARRSPQASAAARRRTGSRSTTRRST